MIQTVTITDLRKNIFEMFSGLEKNGSDIVVEKDGRKVALIKPYNKVEFDWDQYKVDLEKAVAHLSKYDWSDVLELRKKTRARKYKGW